LSDTATAWVTMPEKATMARRLWITSDSFMRALSVGLAHLGERGSVTARFVREGPHSGG
jgi:hypothetical protein